MPCAVLAPLSQPATTIDGTRGAPTTRAGRSTSARRRRSSPWRHPSCSRASTSLATSTSTCVFKHVHANTYTRSYTHSPTLFRDDCWSEHDRNATGHLQPSATQFPNGFKYLTDAIHKLGLKIGLYTCVGTKVRKRGAAVSWPLSVLTSIFKCIDLPGWSPWLLWQLRARCKHNCRLGI